MKVKVEKGAYAPKKAHPTDAGFDIYTPKDFTLHGGGVAIIDTGVSVQIPAGYCGLICNKSGLAFKDNIETVLGVVDSGYTGNIKVKLVNHGSFHKFFAEGDKISQLVIVAIHPDSKMEVVDDLPQTERGTGGFGSTGR